MKEGKKKRRPYLLSDLNATKEELLQSAKSDKLITSNAEFRELFVERTKRFFEKESEARDIYKRILLFLCDRMNNKIPIKVDWFGTIYKKYKKVDHRYDFIKNEYVSSEYYVIRYTADRRFRRYFIDPENRQALKMKIYRRIRAFIKEFGKVKIINKR
jgi:hypothetical protein